VQLGWDDVARLVLVGLLCLGVLGLVTYTLDTVNEGERDELGNLVLDKALGLQNNTLVGLKRNFTRPALRRVGRRWEMLQNTTRTAQDTLMRTKDHMLNVSMELSQEHAKRVFDFAAPIRQQVSKDVRVKVRELHTPQGRASLAHALDQNIRALVDGATHQGGQLVDSTYKIHRPMIREIATLQKATSTGNNSHLEAYMSDKAEQATHATESALFALGKLAHQAGKPFSNVNPYAEYKYAVTQFYVKDDTARQYCQEAVTYCSRKQGCKDALPPRHSIGKHHDESLFFVKIAPSSSPGRQMEDFVSVFLRMRCDNVDCPIFYDEMKHLVQRDDLDSELRYAQERFSFISREFDKSGELHSAVEHPEKYASGMMTMVHNPSERMIRQFMHDTLSDPGRTQCANNTEEMAQCCQGQLETFLCSKYYNYEISTLLGKPWSEVPDDKRWEALDQAYAVLQKARFMGLDESPAASMCLFMYQFQFDEQFEYNCLKPEVTNLPHIKRRVEQMNEKRSIDTRMVRGDRPDLTKVRAGQKYGYNFVDKVARQMIKYDNQLYADAARLFWRRIAAIWQARKLKINCNGMASGDWTEVAW